MVGGGVKTYVGKTNKTFTHLQMNCPLSHFFRASVFSGNKSSGLCKTSTRTESSA